MRGVSAEEGGFCFYLFFSFPPFILPFCHSPLYHYSIHILVFLLFVLFFSTFFFLLLFFCFV